MSTIVFGGAVLTGGRSERMGRDKALLAYDGEPMAVRVTRALEQAGATTVYCVGGDVVALAELGLVAYPDDRQGDGPLAGIASAFEYTEAPVLFVAACDLAELDADTVTAVVDALTAAPDADVALVADEPMCAAWRVAATRAVVEQVLADGGRSVRSALDRLRAVPVTEIDPRRLKNVNAPGDVP